MLVEVKDLSYMPALEIHICLHDSLRMLTQIDLDFWSSLAWFV